MVVACQGVLKANPNSQWSNCCQDWAQLDPHSDTSSFKSPCKCSFYENSWCAQVWIRLMDPSGDKLEDVMESSTRASGRTSCSTPLALKGTTKDPIAIRARMDSPPLSLGCDCLLQAKQWSPFHTQPCLQLKLPRTTPPPLQRLFPRKHRRKGYPLLLGFAPQWRQIQAHDKNRAYALLRFSVLYRAVLDKYKAAAQVVASAVKTLAPQLVDGASVLELCKAGDAALEAEAGKVYNLKGAKAVQKVGADL